MNDSSRILLACAVLVILQWIVFWPALDNKFVAYDDDTYVYANPAIQSLGATSVLQLFSHPYFHSYTPVTLLSHAIDYAVWKANPWGHHLTSVMLHSVNSVLLFSLSLILFRAIHAGGDASRGASTLRASTTSELAGAFVAAALFSIHPLRAESVAWVSDRKDLLLALFSLSSVIAYILYAMRRESQVARRWYALSLACLLLALLSKSTAVVLPVIFLLLDPLLFPKDNWRERLKEKLPFFLLALVFGAVSAVAAKDGTASDIVFRLSGFEKILLPFYTLIFYPVKILWPNNLAPVYDIPDISWMVVGFLVSTAVTILAFVQARRGNKQWLIAWLCYVVGILPTITGLSAGIQPWADRYSYVPTMSLFILAGAGVAKFAVERNRTRLQAWMPGVVIIFLTWAYMSRQQTAVWKDSETLFRYAVEKAPSSPMAHGSLGQALLENNDLDRAIESLGKAVALWPRYPGALYNTGIAFERKQMPDSAAKYYADAIMIDSTYVSAYVNYANLFVTRNQLDEAISLYEKAAELAPSDPDVYYNFGNALYLKGDRGKALECFQTTVKLSPNYASAYNNIGVVLLDLGNTDAALENFQHAARLGSPDAQQLLKSKGYSW